MVEQVLQSSIDSFAFQIAHKPCQISVWSSLAWSDLANGMRKENRVTWNNSRAPANLIMLWIRILRKAEFQRLLVSLLGVGGADLFVACCADIGAVAGIPSFGHVPIHGGKAALHCALGSTWVFDLLFLCLNTHLQSSECCASFICFISSQF